MILHQSEIGISVVNTNLYENEENCYKVGSYNAT